MSSLGGPGDRNTNCIWDYFASFDVVPAFIERVAKIFYYFSGILSDVIFTAAKLYFILTLNI